MTRLYDNIGDLDYKVSNSIRCNVPNRTVYNNDWRYNADDRGWTSSFNITDLSFLGGSMHGARRLGGQIAYVEQPFSNVGVVPSVNYIELVLRVKSRNARTAKLQFIKQDNNDDSVSTIDTLNQKIEFDLIRDGAWHLYRLDPNALGSWQGIITRLRLFPFVEGVAEDEFFVQFIRIVDVSPETTSCVCTTEDFFYNVPSPCTGAGRGAAILGSQISSDRLTITEFNNTFEISFNDSDFRTITLDKTNRSVTVGIVLADMERRINSVSSPGFMNATVELTSENCVRIGCGIRGEDTSVNIKHSPLLEYLGFFNKYRSEIFTSFDGVNDTNDFEGVFELDNESLRRISDGSLNSSVTFNPEQYLVEGGNALYSFNYYVDPFPMKEVTLIDYLKPINNNGRITKGFFYGTLLQNPQSKLKIFRPIGHDRLKFIGEAALSPDVILNNPKITSPPLPFNQILRDYEASLELDVRMGDLLALTNVVLYSYAQYGNPALLTYMKAQGDVTWDLDLTKDVEFYGNGMKALPIYVRSDAFREVTRLFFDFGQQTAVDKVVFEYKPSEAVKMGSNLSSSVTDITVDTRDSEHGYWRYVSTSNGLEQVSNTRTTVAHNIDLLMDGVRTAIGGSDSSYFYLDGDGQIGNTDYTDPGLASSGSFVKDQFDIIIDLSPDFNKEIGSIALYFVEPLNWVEYGLFYENGGQRIPFDITGISFDERPVSAGSAFYMNPLIAETDNDETAFDVQTIIRLSTAVVAKRKALFLVQPVKTKRIIFEVYRHFSTKMTEIEIASPEAVGSTGFNIMGSDIFSVFVANDNLQFEQIDFSNDTTVEGRQLNTSVMTIGKPINYAVVEIRPPLIFELFNVKFISEKIDDHTPRFDEDFIDSNTEGTTLSVAYDEDRELIVTNESSHTADLVVDILPDDTYDTHDIVLYSDLSSIEDLVNPKRGSTGLYKFSDDHELKITYDVLRNRPAWGAYNYNSLNPRSTSWTSLGTSLTDSTTANNIDAPIGCVESNVNAPSNYTGDVESGGSYNETYDIEYHVHIDTTNGTLPDSGVGLSPRFTVTTIPSVDDVSTPVVIEHTNTYYEVGTKGVLIRFNTFTQFGDDDLFIIRTYSASNRVDGINAKDYGYVAFDIGQQFFIDSTEIVAVTEFLNRRENPRSWKNEPEFFSISSNKVSTIDKVSFGSFGAIDGPARWLMISWDFSQGSRGGWLNQVSMNINETPFYSNKWWEVSSVAGNTSRELYNIGPDNERGSATKFIYNSGETGEVVYSINEDATWTPDPLWSLRDFLNFNFYVENISNIDYLIVRIGTDSENYYEWDITSNLLESQWFSINLRFTEASITGHPALYSAISYFRFLLKGNGNNQPISFISNSLKIRRNKFDDIVHDGVGTYLNGQEFISFFPIENLTLSQGTVEVWFSPDYDSDGFFENVVELQSNDNTTFNMVKDYKYYPDERIYTHSLISIVAGIDFYATVGVQTSLNGLTLYTNNLSGDEIRDINDVTFNWYTPHHLALTWKYDFSTLNLEMRLYVDNVWVKHIFTPWQGTYDSNLNLVLGGSVDPDVFIIQSDSASAAFQKLKVSNYPIYDFSDRADTSFDIENQVKNNDLFLVNVNDLGFNQYGDEIFPLRIKEIPPGGTANLKVRFARPVGKKIPSTLSRKGKIDFKWELK